MEDYPDSTDDPEERRRRIEARIEAENFGAIVGVTIGVASVIVDRLANRAQTPEQAEELEILEQEEYNEYRAQNELWQQNM